MRAIALLLCMVLTSTALVAQGTGVVTGTIRDEVGAPVGEVLVVIDPDSLSLRTRTGADGRYRITVPRGRFEVRIVRIGYRPQSHTIDVADRPLELNVTLQSVAIPLATVAVRVSRPGLHGLVVTRGIELLPHEPRPLRDATIEVLNEPFRVKSDRDGRFSIPQLPIGSHTILITLDRYATAMLPVTIPADGGVELTFTLDSLYADYQFREQDQMRQMGVRLRKATSPATFVSAHELDRDARNLREGLRYANSVLSRGVVLMGVTATIYIDGKAQPGLQLQDIQMSDMDIQGIEVYPANSLQTDAGVVPGLEGPIFSGGERGRGSFSRRTLARSRGNQGLLIIIWTNRGR